MNSLFGCSVFSRNIRFTALLFVGILASCFLSVGTAFASGEDTQNVSDSFIEKATSQIVDLHQTVGEFGYRLLASSLETYDDFIARAADEVSYVFLEVENPSRYVQDAASASSQQAFFLYEKGLSNYVEISSEMPQQVIASVSGLGSITGGLVSAAVAQVVSYSVPERFILFTYQTAKTIFGSVSETVSAVFSSTSDFESGVTKEE